MWWGIKQVEHRPRNRRLSEAVLNDASGSGHKAHPLLCPYSGIVDSANARPCSLLGILLDACHERARPGLLRQDRGRSALRGLWRPSARAKVRMPRPSFAGGL